MEIEALGTHVVKRSSTGDKLTISVVKSINISQLIVKEEKEYRPNRKGREYLRIKKSDILKKWTGTNKEHNMTTQFICAQTKYGLIIGEQSWLDSSRYGEVYRATKAIYSVKEFEEFIEEVKEKYTGGENAWVLYESVVPGLPDKRQPTIMRIEDNDDKSIDAIGPHGEQGIFAKPKGLSVYQTTMISYNFMNNLGVEFDIQLKGLTCGFFWFIYQNKVYKAINFRLLDILLNHCGKQISIIGVSKNIIKNSIYTALDYYDLGNKWIVSNMNQGMSVNQYKRVIKNMKRNKFKLDTHDIELFLQEALLDITEAEKNSLIGGA